MIAYLKAFFKIITIIVITIIALIFAIELIIYSYNKAYYFSYKINYGTVKNVTGKFYNSHYLETINIRDDNTFDLHLKNDTIEFLINGKWHFSEDRMDLIFKNELAVILNKDTIIFSDTTMFKPTNYRVYSKFDQIRISNVKGILGTYDDFDFDSAHLLYYKVGNKYDPYITKLISLPRKNNYTIDSLIK